MLAYADSGDSGTGSLQTVVICVGIIAAAGMVALVPIVLARSRKNKSADIIVAVTLLWAVLTAWSAVATTLAQVKWSAEKMQSIQSGYYDPRDNTHAPLWPVGIWAALGAGYAAMTVWAMRRP